MNFFKGKQKEKKEIISLLEKELGKNKGFSINILSNQITFENMKDFETLYLSTGSPELIKIKSMYSFTFSHKNSYWTMKFRDVEQSYEKTYAPIHNITSI